MGEQMKYFLRPSRGMGIAKKRWWTVALVGTGLAYGALRITAQTSDLTGALTAPHLLLLHSGSTQGYMGVLVEDVDADAATKLKLKDTRGAVVSLIDHDAPAAQAGVRVNDVVLQVNGQAVENAEQFGRMLHGVPAGASVSLAISREGALQTMTVQLV